MPWTQAPVRVLLPTLYFLTLDLFKCDELCTLLCYLDALQDVSIIALLLVVQEAVKMVSIHIVRGALKKIMQL